MRLLARPLVAVLIAGVLLVVRVLSADTSDKGLFDLTKFGPAALVPGYESDMPGFRDKLSDADIWGVLSYIESTWPADIRARQQKMNERKP